MKPNKYINNNFSYRLMWKRLNDPSSEPPDQVYAAISGIKDQGNQLLVRGGFSQQDRMIKDKLRSLHKALLYSYQGAWIKKIPNSVQATMDDEEIKPVRALINSNKIKQDYDEKILSVDFEYGFTTGDVFEWCNTQSYWLIYLQELSELAYFRGRVMRCNYQIKWTDEEGETKTAYASVRGPIETRIDSIDKHSTIVDMPNYSLNILMPKTADTMKKFVRYAKFYLNGAEEPDKNICWRVEATDSISMPGILEINAVEYYANEFEDDIENGVVGALIEEEQDPNASTEEEIIYIVGDTFIKPKKEYIYKIGGDFNLEWNIQDKTLPVILKSFQDDKGNDCVKVKWTSTYSGQFDLYYGTKYKKTIVVESLF